MIKLEGVFSGYNREPVLKDIYFEVEEGFVGVIGPNGAGKSTLLKTIASLVEVYEGALYINGKSVTDYKRKELSKILTLVSQDFFPIYDYTVRELVEMGRIAHQGFFPNWTKEDEEQVKIAINTLGIKYLERRRYSQISSGEKRLVMLARAIAQNVRIILVDELELHLDPKHKMVIASYLKKLSKMGIIILAVFHDIDLALSYSDRIIGVKEGRITFDLDVSSSNLREHLEKLYGVDFVEVNGNFGKRIFPFYK
ncbi:MAG: ABC transporter ATP-binding protein [Thermotogaceae bacterium]|nr:ABC transporter ATP-binding protein [Thermotogaceae bacterium]